ncbi:hypothetical protein Tco_0066874 [Tanacetum coccineum]
MRMVEDLKSRNQDEISDGEIVPESLFEDGELENNQWYGIFSKRLWDSKWKDSHSKFGRNSLEHKRKMKVKLWVWGYNGENGFNVSFILRKGSVSISMDGFEKRRISCFLFLEEWLTWDWPFDFYYGRAVGCDGDKLRIDFP